MYKKWKSGQYQLCDVHDPMVGSKVLHIMHTVTNCIVMRKSDLSSIVKGFHDESKGDGSNSNAMKEARKICPLFQNKAPLRPIKAAKVQVSHQVDLVNMMSMPVTVDEVTYKYIMSVIDIFSRFVFLRPLKSKESAEVAENLFNYL